MQNNSKSFIFKLFLLLTTMALLFSCRKEDDFITDPSASLEFSTDSIAFDTVFTTIGSVTKTLKIFNGNNKAIKISSLQLESGPSSNFRINVDGTPATQLKDVEIAADDSLYIFIRVTVDPTNENAPFVISDRILFETNSNLQDVDLVAWGQNAYYIVADQQIEGLPPFKIVASEFSDTTWDSKKPYLIYGYAVVDSNAILRIDDSARIHFHNNSGLWVYKGGALKVNGTRERPVVFQGDRLDFEYRNIPGQWDRIWINEGSVDNEINYAIIRNGFIGIQAETLQEQMGNRLIIRNTIIENMTGIGLFSRFYNIEAENTVVANCGNYGAALTLGGIYDFTHCTFANFWNQSVRQQPNLFLNNFYLDENNAEVAFPMDAWFGNCIIAGQKEEEIQYEISELESFNYLFDHALLKTQMDVSNTQNYKDIILNEDPLFADYDAFDYHPDTLSPVINAGSPEIAQEVPLDLDGVNRLPEPDLGAYEFVPGK